MTERHGTTVTLADLQSGQTMNTRDEAITLPPSRRELAGVTYLSRPRACARETAFGNLAQL